MTGFTSLNYGAVYPIVHRTVLRGTVTAVFALSARVLRGLADFGGGLLTRRAPALTVVVVSQSIAVVALGVTVTATGG
jgi:type III secretory pathway component EscT